MRGQTSTQFDSESWSDEDDVKNKCGVEDYNMRTIWYAQCNSIWVILFIIRYGLSIRTVLYLYIPFHVTISVPRHGIRVYRA